MTDAVTRYRSRAKDTDLRPPPARENQRHGDHFTLLDSTVHRMLWERMRRENVEQTHEGEVVRRRHDQPYTGQVVVMNCDERVAKTGKATVLADFNGPVPVIAMGGDVEYWQDLKDLVDEHRHYKQDTISRDEIPAPNAQEVWTQLVERNQRWQKGLITYGAETKGRLKK